MNKKNKTKRTKRQQFFYVAFILLFLFILVRCIGYLSRYLVPISNQMVVELPMQILPPGESSFLPKEGTIFSTKLVQDFSDAKLMIRTQHQWLAIYLGERLIFSTPRPSSESDPGLEMYYISLSDYIDKELYVVVNSISSLFQTSLQNVYLGSADGLRTFVISSSLPYLVIALLCVLGGVFLSAAAIFSGFYHLVNYSNFFLGLFSIVWGLNGTTSLLIAYDFFSPEALSNVALILHYLNPLPLGLFIYYRLTRYRKWATPVVLLLILCFLFIISAPVFNITYISLSEYLSPAYQAIFLYILMISIFDIFSGNTFFKRMIPFAIPLLVATTIQVIDFYTLSFSTTKIKLLAYVCYFILIIGVWILSGIDFYQIWREKETEMNEIRLRNNLITASYTEIVNKNRYILSIKHEMQHLLATLQVLLVESNAAQAKSFLGEISTWSFLRAETFSDNHLVNAIVCEINHQAKQNSVYCEWKIDVPANLQLNVNVLSSILMNLLENALEATVHLPIDQRSLKLTMSVKNKYLFIKCENSAHLSPSMVKGNFSSTKKHGSNHGLGLLIINRLVEENGGLIKIEAKENFFIASLALLLEETT